eukprot:768392-Hanusia_phi.AAC.7
MQPLVCLSPPVPPPLVSHRLVADLFVLLGVVPQLLSRSPRLAHSSRRIPNNLRPKGIEFL